MCHNCHHSHRCRRPCPGIPAHRLLAGIRGPDIEIPPDTTRNQHHSHRRRTPWPRNPECIHTPHPRCTLHAPNTAHTPPRTRSPHTVSHHIPARNHQQRNCPRRIDSPTDRSRTLHHSHLRHTPCHRNRGNRYRVRLKNRLPAHHTAHRFRHSRRNRTLCPRNSAHRAKACTPPCRTRKPLDTSRTGHHSRLHHTLHLRRRERRCKCRP